MSKLFAWLRNHALAAIGSVPALLEAGRWCETLLRWGEHSEFVLHRLDDVKMLWTTLIAAPPQWINVPLIVGGFVLIWWDLVRARNRRTMAGGPAVEGPAIEGHSGETTPASQNLEGRLAKLERLQRLSNVQTPPEEFQRISDGLAKLIAADDTRGGELDRQNRHLSLVSKENNTFLTILLNSLSIAFLHSLSEGPHLAEIAEIIPDTMAERQETADKYYRQAMGLITGTRWAPELEDYMLQQNAEMGAEMQIRKANSLPNGLRELEVRHYLIAKIKAEYISRHLSNKKQEHTVKELRGLLKLVDKTIAERAEFDRTGEFRP